MKKKTYKLLLVCMLAAVIFAATGCSRHKHTLHLVERKDSTCAEMGHESYYTCECGLMFFDEAGKHQIEEPVVIPLKAHTLTEVEAKAASCTESGLLHHWKCSVCKMTFTDAEGKNAAKDIVDYALGHNVTCYPEKLPTTKSAGMKAHFVCQNCGGIFLDKSCSERTTNDTLSIPRVEEDLDGTLTQTFYSSQRALYLGGSDLSQGGVGVVVNARTGERGVYLHMLLNHQYEHVAKDGNVVSFLRFYLTANNKQNSAYTGRGVGENDRDVKIEFSLNGMTGGDSLYLAQYQKTIKNPAGKKTPYTSVREVFIPYEELAAANHGALRDAFENKNGVYSLKKGYKLYSSIVGCMFVNSDWKAETFTSTSTAGCDSKDDGWWNFWFVNGYGDWSRDQKMMELSEGGLIYSSPSGSSNGTYRPAAPSNGLTLDGEGKATGTTYYQEAKPEQSESVANSKYAIVETTLKYNGNVGFWSHRFGIMMTERKGIGTTVLPADAGDPRLQVFPLYGENPNDIFAGWSNTYSQYYNAVVSALNGKGLPLRMVRSDTHIYQYAYLNGAWVQFGDPVTCDTNAKTDISFVICDGYWTFMDPVCGALEFVPEKAPQVGVGGNHAYLRSADGTKLYTLEGIETTEADVTINALGIEHDLELQVKGRKDGNTTVLADGTLVVLVPQYGENVEATVVGGKIKVDLAHGIYTVTAGEYEGTLSVVKESLPTEIILGYKFATSTGTAGYGSVDFSMMNETNHSLTLEGSGVVAGTYQYVEAKLNQPDSAAESKYAVVETTVRFNGDVGLWSHRFGIKMTADKGVGVTVLPSDAAEPRLQVFELYAENASDILAGWSSAYTQYYDEVVAALNGDGLKLRVVRSDTQIIPYAYLNEAWVQFGDKVTCDTNAKTDIRFAICDGSWTFSNIESGALEYVPEKAPQIGVSGNRAHLLSADGKLYTLDGAETTVEDITLPALENLTLELQVKGRKDGNTAVLPNGTLVVLVPEIGERVEATISNGKINVILQSGNYAVTAGDYEGTLSVVRESPPTELTLGYKYATSTGTDGYGSADFSNMNEANHALTLDGCWQANSTSRYVEAKLNLPGSVADSKYAIVETTVKFNGEVGYWAHRFGIKMTADKGMGITVLPADASPALQVFALYEENANDIFAGWSNAYTQYYDAVVAALNGEGLQLRMVRSDTNIILYAYLNGAWVQFGDKVTCDTNAQTDIRFLVCDGSWTFSNSNFGALEYVPERAAQIGVSGNRAHLRTADGKLYTLDGVETTVENITIAALEDLAYDLELPVTYKKDGTVTAFADGTLIVLTSETGENIQLAVTDGKITADLPYGTYTATTGDYEGTLSVVKESLPTELKLEYKYATSTGTDGYGSVDLSQMNEANHVLTLDGRGEAAGTDRYVEAKLNLPGEVADSKYAIVETTLKFNGNVGFWSHRFGIKMTADKGIGATVVPSDWGDPRLQVFALYGENASNIFDGWSNAYTQYYDAVVAALNGSGLKLRLVRSDTQIIPYAYLNEAWVQFGDPVPCDTNAKTDIRFLVCDGSWTFRNTGFGALEYIPAREAQPGVNGNLAHLRAEDGKLYTLEGVETTEEDVTITSELTLNGGGTKTSDAQYEEARLELPDNVAESKYAIVETTVRFNGGAEDRPWWYRFGIKMTENDGVGVLNFGDILNAFELYGNPDAVFSNAVGIDYPQYKAAVDAALNGSGLKLRVVRSDTQITQYAFLNGEWVEFGPVVTCDTNAQTDIRFLVCDGSWTFSNTVISDNTETE